MGILPYGNGRRKTRINRTLGQRNSPEGRNNAGFAVSPGLPTIIVIVMVMVVLDGYLHVPALTGE